MLLDMSVLVMNIESTYLRQNQEISVILPDVPPHVKPRTFFESGEKYKVLWLLHGTFGDHSDWIRRTNIELYACEKNLAVVMPSALNSNYSNWPNSMMGYNMYDYMIEELMPMIYNWFPVSSQREDNFIAGLSMGGRGCIKFAVNFPEKFAAAAVLSAAPQDFHKFTDNYLNSDDYFAERLRGMIKNAGGFEKFVNLEEKVLDPIDELAPTGRLPKLLFAYGTGDTVIVDRMRDFRKHAQNINLDCEFWTLEGYGHEWRFWDLAIQHSLDFFGLKNTGYSKF